MPGKANSEVTPAFAVSLQKPQGSITVGFCLSYLTLHTQSCSKERLTCQIPCNEINIRIMSKTVFKSCYPNSKLIDQLKSCHPGACVWSLVLVGATLRDSERGRIFVPGTPLLHPRHYLVWFRAKEASSGSTWSSKDYCIYLVHYPALSYVL